MTPTQTTPPGTASATQDGGGGLLIRQLQWWGAVVMNHTLLTCNTSSTYSSSLLYEGQASGEHDIAIHAGGFVTALKMLLTAPIIKFRYVCMFTAFIVPVGFQGSCPFLPLLALTALTHLTLQLPLTGPS